MSWGLGEHEGRDIGYGVPAIYDHPRCNARIDRGLSYVCCSQQPYGGERGCGRFFCHDHGYPMQRCSRCSHGREPFPMKPDVREWIEWKLKDKSWAAWRKGNPEAVAELKAALLTAIVHGSV